MQIFDGGKLWRIFHQKILASKTLVNSCCLLYLFMSQDIIKICMVKFGEPPVIRQIYQGFICQKFVLTVFGSLLESAFGISCCMDGKLEMYSCL